jgi:hypothetical protein
MRAALPSPFAVLVGTDEALVARAAFSSRMLSFEDIDHANKGMTTLRSKRASRGQQRRQA